MKKVLIGIGIVALVTGLSLIGLRRLTAERSAAAADLQTVPVRRGTVISTVAAAGGIAPLRQLMLSFSSGGQVKRVYVREGDLVEEGQILAQLDTTDLELEVAQARLSLAISEAQLAELQAGPTPSDVAAAQTALRSAQLNLEQVQAGPSASEVAAAEASLKAAWDNYRELLLGPNQDEITVAQADLRQAEIALQQAQGEYDRVAWRGDLGASQQAANLQQATIDYERALADFNLANQTATQAELESAWAEVNQAQDELDNLANSPTESELESARAQVAQAQAQLDELMAGPSSHELAIAEAQVEQAWLSLQQAELQLAEATLGAPFRGTVVSLSVEEGETVAANAEAVLLADLSALEISLDMDEVDVGRVQLGQAAGVFLDAFPDQALRGEVTQIAYVGTETQGVVNYPVTVRIDPNDLPIKPGMTANASIVIERRENVLVVPNRALKARGQQWVVEVLVEGEITEVPVKAGLSGDTGTEVVEGLQEGDLVVIGTTQAGGESQGRGFGGPPFGGGPHF